MLYTFNLYELMMTEIDKERRKLSIIHYYSISLFVRFSKSTVVTKQHPQLVLFFMDASSIPVL